MRNFQDIVFIHKHMENKSLNQPEFVLFCNINSGNREGNKINCSGHGGKIEIGYNSRSNRWISLHCCLQIPMQNITKILGWV